MVTPSLTAVGRVDEQAPEGWTAPAQCCHHRWGSGVGGEQCLLHPPLSPPIWGWLSSGPPTWVPGSPGREHPHQSVSRPYLPAVRPELAADRVASPCHPNLGALFWVSSAFGRLFGSLTAVFWLRLLRSPSCPFVLSHLPPPPPPHTPHTHTHPAVLALGLFHHLAWSVKVGLGLSILYSQPFAN